MRIIVKNIPVKTHHFDGLIEHYHGPLYQIYSIITIKLLGIKLKLALQIFFKVFNNSIESNGLVPTLLMFGAHFCMINIDTSSSIINQYSIVMHKVIKEVRRFHTS